MRSSIAAGVIVTLFHSQAPAPSALRIVVLEGEDAVNIVQQKTAVRPLVEVRDRNNLPVAGATVTFTIGGGQPAAFAGGLQTLTVTTNAAGQAAAPGLNALSSGAFQIQVQAAYQGQIATAAISQTNFATAAAAAQAGGSTSSAAGGAAGGGGGMSGTTIAIIGAAVGGGALVAAKAAGALPGGGHSYSGSFSGQVVVTTTTTSQNGGVSTCLSTRELSGTVEITLRDDATGTANVTGTNREISVTGPQCSPLSTPGVSFNTDSDVSGGPSALTFRFDSSSTSPTPNGGGSVTSAESRVFSGSLSGGAITGTLIYTHATRGTNLFNGVSSTIEGNGSITMPVTLR